MRNRQTGFTLVELIVVIVVLGILAATAIPRFANFTQQSRIAALNGVAGAIHGATTIVQGRFIANGTGLSPVTMLDGTTVAVSIRRRSARRRQPVPRVAATPPACGRTQCGRGTAS